MSGRRLLVVANAPVHPVIGDVLDGLRRRGWDVEMATFTAPSSSTATSPLIERALRSPFAPVRNSARVLRRGLREVRGIRAASTWFTAIDVILEQQRHDAVLAFLDVLPFGAARLVSGSRIPVLCASMQSLAREYAQRRALRGLRRLAGLLHGSLHDDLLVSIDNAHVLPTVFPSETWRHETALTGLKLHTSRVITYGVPITHDTRARSDIASPARLLWVGRLSEEKGLHLFLDALPIVTAHSRVVLTAICGNGPEAYRSLVDRRIKEYGLESVVTLKAAVSRDVMLDTFGEHDLLLFHSPFSEPVAQVMLHAAVAGLPVVGPASSNPRSLLQEGRTAWCYAEGTSVSIADAIGRALGAENAERRRRAEALRHAVAADHDLEQTIAAYHTLLSSLADGVTMDGPQPTD